MYEPIYECFLKPNQTYCVCTMAVTRTALRRCVRRLDFDHHVSIDGHGVSDRGSQSVSQPAVLGVDWC